MDFSEALKELKQGRKVTNGNWNGKGMYLEVQNPDKNSKMKHPYIYMKNALDELVPWTPSQLDLFSENWKVKLILKWT